MLNILFQQMQLRHWEFLFAQNPDILIKINIGFSIDDSLF